MSYCRFGLDGSDVYVIAVGGERGEWCCVRCGLAPGLDGNAYCRDRPQMIRHLEYHRERGHTVPQYAIDRLRNEAA